MLSGVLVTTCDECGRMVEVHPGIDRRLDPDCLLDSLTNNLWAWVAPGGWTIARVGDVYRHFCTNSCHRDYLTKHCLWSDLAYLDDPNRIAIA